MKINSLSIVLVLWTCAACNPLAPRPDRTQYFILSPVGQQGSGAAAGASRPSTSQLSLGVGPIKFPDYLKRPGVVTRTTANRLLVSDQKMWGEPLDRNFTSILGQNLSDLLGTERITNYPWYADTHIDYQVQVRVDRFEATEGGQSQLQAAWTIRSGRDGRELASGATDATAPAQGGDEAASAALSADLGQMSRQIADRIVQLNESSTRRRAPAGFVRSMSARF